MEIELISEQIHNYARVFARTFSREETVETVVPDTMPDVQQIIDTDAMVYLRSKETEDGRLQFSGNLEGTVLYSPEGESGIRRLSLSTPFSFTVEDARLQKDCRVQISLRCTSAEARLLNPRKVLLRAEISADVEAYCGTQTCYSTAADGEGLQVLQNTVTVDYVAAVEEKTFVIAEEFSLPPSVPALSELLRSRVSAAVDDIRQVAGKIIFQGTVRLEILYTAGEGECPRRECFSTTFSQILDMQCEQCSRSFVTLAPTAAYVEAMPGTYGGNGVSMELHLVAQAVCCAERELCYLADAYSTRCACETGTEKLNFSGSGRTLLQRETLRELLETPENVGEVVDCYVMPGQPVCVSGGVRIPLSVHVIYMTDRGVPASVCRRLQCESAVSVPEDAALRIGVPQCNEPYVAAASGGLELRLPIALELTVLEQQELETVTAVTLHEEQSCVQAGRPSVMVVRNQNGDLWSLAKKYGSTPELIRAANAQDAETGSFLLIPRAR